MDKLQDWFWVHDEFGARLESHLHKELSVQIGRQLKIRITRSTRIEMGTSLYWDLHDSLCRADPDG